MSSINSLVSSILLSCLSSNSLSNTMTTNIESWCQRVLDLLDLKFAELCGITWNIWEISIISLDFALQMDISLTFLVPLVIFRLFLSNKGGSKW